MIDRKSTTSVEIEDDKMIKKIELGRTYNLFNVKKSWKQVESKNIELIRSLRKSTLQFTIWATTGY